MTAGSAQLTKELKLQVALFADEIRTALLHEGRDSFPAVVGSHRGGNGHSFKLAIENLDKPVAEYAAFVDRIGSDGFGMVIDIGHTMDDDGVNPFTHKGRAREDMALCGKRLISLHLHDYLYERAAGDHVSPLDGSIEWAEVFAALKEVDSGMGEG